MAASRPKLKVRYFHWRTSNRGEFCDYGASLLFQKFYNIEVCKDDPDITFLSLPDLYNRYGYPQGLDEIRGTRVAVSEEYWTRHRNWLSDYTFSSNPTTDRNYYLPTYRADPAYEKLFEPRDPTALMSNKRGFCSFLYANGNTYIPGVAARNRFFDKLHDAKPVSAMGSIRNNMPMPTDKRRHQLNYLVAKRELIAPYKFNIAFENFRAPGYQTEKITDAFIAGSVPIYLGDPNIAQIFNPRAFINVHDFKNFDDAIRWILTVDADDDLYMDCLSEPPFRDNREPDVLSIEPLRERMNEIAQSPRRVSRNRYHRKKAQLILGTSALNPTLRYLYLSRFHPQHGWATVAKTLLFEPALLGRKLCRDILKSIRRQVERRRVKR